LKTYKYLLLRNDKNIKVEGEKLAYLKFSLNKEEIDIVAFDDNNITFIECKWQNSVKKQSIIDKLILKAQNIKHNKKDSYLVVTKDEYLGE